VGWGWEYGDETIDASYELQICHFPNLPDQLGVVLAPDKRHGHFVLAIPAALATIKEGKLHLLDEHHCVDMNRVRIFVLVGQLNADNPQGPLST
jgi:hypothetical protein